MDMNTDKEIKATMNTILHCFQWHQGRFHTESEIDPWHPPVCFQGHTETDTQCPPYYCRLMTHQIPSSLKSSTERHRERSSRMSTVWICLHRTLTGECSLRAEDGVSFWADEEMWGLRYRCWLCGGRSLEVGVGGFWKRAGSYLVLSPQEAGKLVSPTKNNIQPINIRLWLTIRTTICHYKIYVQEFNIHFLHWILTA